MKLLNTALAAGTLLLASPLHAMEWPAPVAALQAKGIEVLAPFDAPAGLRGYAAQYRGQGLALYLTADGQQVLLGTLFDAQGNDLSQATLEKLVYEPLGEQQWQKLEKSRWIADGRADAPRVVYLFSDPNCPYCNQFWRQARPWVEAGQVQLRHIMVGILREESRGKAAALLASADPAQALAEHEREHKASRLQVLKDVPDAVRQQLDGNHALMEEMGAMATPAIYYQDASGRLQQHLGAPRDEEQLRAILGAR